MAPEPDRGEVPHPRDRHVLFGHAEATAALREAHASGRLHHAWLIGGPEGVGKATLAYRFARWLLAPAAEHVASGDGLAVDPAGRTARQISAGSHPNLMIIEQAAAEGEKSAPKTIPVGTVRRALSFFATTAADAGRRICIIDSVEDLSLAAANALLKPIEEPPSGALILLASHAPQTVLPTIRSRCRKLSLAPLSQDVVGLILASLGPAFEAADKTLTDRAARAAEGSVARALALLDPRRLALLDEVSGLLDRLPDLPIARVLALADRLGERRAEAEFSLALDTVLHWLSQRVKAGQYLGAARLAPLAEACENVTEAARALEVYNLDRRAFIVSTFGDLAEAVRRSA